MYLVSSLCQLRENMFSNKKSFEAIIKYTSPILLVSLLFTAYIIRPQLQYVLFGYQLPAPQGIYKVGRISLDIKDPKRPEVFTSDPNDHRKIHVDVYYPALDMQTNTHSAYLHPSIVKGITGLPPFAVHPITPNWRDSAPPNTSSAPYPVLLFSPGSDSPPTLYTSLFEQLTSHGYIICALWHPYSTARIRYTDGRIIESKFAGNGAMF